MTTQPDMPPAADPQRARRRAEKLSALAALLGDEAMERLRKRDAGFAVPDAAPSPDDSERIAWQRSRLLERLRSRWADGSEASSAYPTETKSPGEVAAKASPGIETRIAAAVDLSTLADEHPAVIAHVLQGLDRERRVAVLRALPGPTARVAIRRFRSP